MGLVNPKDVKVDKMAEHINTEAFRTWKHGVEKYIDSVQGGRRGSLLLEQARLCESKIDQQQYDQCVQAANGTELGMVMPGYDWEFNTKSVELYDFLAPKLNLTLFNELRQVGTTNGFELWRLLNKKKDPVRKEQAFFMEINLNNMSHHKAKNFSETYDKMLELEKGILEFRATIGMPPDYKTLVKVMWAMMDIDTQEKAEDRDEVNITTTSP